MTEFTKTKIHFALALLGTLFALHPYLEKYENNGFDYLGYHLKVTHAYVLVAGLLAFCVYCFGLTLVSERSHSWLEKLGNYSYGLAVMVLPFYGGLYLASLLAERLGQSHLAWAAPSVTLGLGVLWFLLSQLFAWRLRGRLGRQDVRTRLEQLARQEVSSLEHAHELFATEHYDVSVMEVWKAVDARLLRALLLRGVALNRPGPDAVIHACKRRAIVREPVLGLLQELNKHWQVAISNDPITRTGAENALNEARQILSTIALPDSVENPGLVNAA